MTLSDAELDALEAMSRLADPGPWEADIDSGFWTGKWYTGGHGRSWAVYDQGDDAVEARSVANATLIAAARNALAPLVAEVRRLRSAQRLADAVLDLAVRQTEARLGGAIRGYDWERLLANDIEALPRRARAPGLR